MRGNIVVIVCLSMVIGASAAEENWPTWRGAGLDGMAGKGDPPITWSESKNIKWKVKLPGDGSSTPVVWGKQMIFQAAVPIAAANKVLSGLEGNPANRKGIFAAIEDSKQTYAFDVVCLDRTNGKQIWKTTVCKTQPHEGYHEDHGYASYSPVTDGKLIWVSFGSRGLYCLDMDGVIKWQKDMPRMKTRVSFGEASSPAIAGDYVVVLMDQEEQSALYAFDKQSGKQAWKKDRDEGTSWTTPVAVEVDGKLQVIVAGSTATRAYDARTGDVIWSAAGHTQNIIPAPVVGFGMVYTMSGFRGNLLQAVKLNSRGDVTGTDAVAWEIKKYTSYVPSPALSHGMIFYGSKIVGKLSCADARTGKVHYQNEELEGVDKIYASIVGVKDRLYIAGRGGAVAVVKAASEFKVLAVNNLDDGFDASPVIIGDILYLKGRKNLYAIAR